MDYQFELQTLLPRTPQVDEAGSHAIEFTLGYIVDYNRIIVMSVMLIPTERQDVLELCFGIRSKEVRADGIEVSEPDYTPDAVDFFVPPEARNVVYRQVLQAIFLLVTFLLPEAITMETYYAKLPLKAMRKHDGVVATVVNAGYMLMDEFRNSDGITYWAFEKLV